MCKCITEKGTVCSRPGKPEYGGNCFQHQHCKIPSSKGSSPNKSPTRRSPVKKIKPKPLPKRPTKAIVKRKSPIKIPISVLPMDVISEIYLQMDPQDVVQTCAASKDKTICNDKFWKLKLKKDFGLAYQKPTGCLKFYIKVAKIYTTLEKEFDTKTKGGWPFKLRMGHKFQQAPTDIKQKYENSDNFFLEFPDIVLYARQSKTYKNKYEIIYPDWNNGEVDLIKDNLSKRSLLLDITQAKVLLKKDKSFEFPQEDT